MPKQTKKFSDKETRDRQEANRLRSFVKDVLYKHLTDNTGSIEDAKTLCAMTKLYVEQAFHKKIVEEQTRVSQMKLSELDLERVIDIDTKVSKDFMEMFKLFDNETIATTTGVIGGMVSAIESFQKEESTKRKLETLKATWL